MFSEAKKIKFLRKLAKSSVYQYTYSLSKEMKTPMFENTRDYTDLQLTFFKFLDFYAALYLEIYMGEVEELVLEHFIYEDAYMYFRQKQDKKDRKTRKEKQLSESQQQNSPINKKGKQDSRATTGTSTWVFKVPPKGR